MPLLQVRDCPTNLYDALKKEAETQRRSVAQQTVIAIEDHFKKQPNGKKSSNERRQRIMDSLILPSDNQHFDPVQIVRESRDE